jgi:hypothetical protein
VKGIIGYLERAFDKITDAIHSELFLYLFNSVKITVSVILTEMRMDLKKVIL